jgi:hypothetical protein
MDPVLLRYQQALGRLAGIFTGTTAMPSSQMPSADVFGGAVYNPIPFTLFWPWDFDLTGRAETSQGESTPGWPLFKPGKWPGYVY